MEIYLYGSQYMVAFIGAIAIVLCTIHVFLPVFFQLQLPCTNHYLELRFSKSVRKLSSVISIFGLIAFTSIVIYAPALAFSRSTGFNVHAITTTLSIVCITYTTIVSVFFFLILSLIIIISSKILFKKIIFN